MSVLASRLSKSLSHLKTVLPVAALAVGLGLMMPVSAFAQHGGGGGGGHGGGGGGGHGGGAAHGGGGFHGGGGWGHGGWGRGGWGWGGFYGGFYPWYGYGYGWDGSYNPFWAYGPDDYYGAAPAYAPAGPEAYGPEAEGYGPQSYGPQSQYYPPASGPADNIGGFYTWQVGVEGGTCNRPYIQQVAVSATGGQPGNLQVGAQLGGIPVQHVIGGRIGPRLDLTDQACATEALEHARIGTTVRWETSTGIPVTFQVTKTVNGQNGQNCRDYEATAQFGSHTDTVRNTACKGTDGAWRATR